MIQVFFLFIYTAVNSNLEHFKAVNKNRSYVSYMHTYKENKYITLKKFIKYYD